jgi:rhodanese-related sulfurtransferase
VTATIGREELKAKIDSRGDVVLVETLDPEYYEDAHLPGAVNLPLDRIGELAPEILPDKDADIVVYCMSSL